MHFDQNNIIFGLDIGTRSIVGIVGYQTPTGFHVQYSHVEMHKTRSMIDGQIHDIEQVALTIKKVKEVLEEKLGLTLKKVCIAAAGRVLKTLTTHVENDIEDTTEITNEVIQALELQGMERAMHQINYQNKDEETLFYCVGYSVTQYYLNGFVMKNLHGHKGTSIGADILSTFLPTEVVNSLYKVIELSGLEVYSLTLEPIAAIEVAIPESYRLLNIALIDIGAGTSDIAITKGGSIIAYGMIPIAGDEITESIVHEYLVDFQTAEKIKIAASGKTKTISFKDAIGLKQTIELEHVRSVMSSTNSVLASQIAEKIIELNGGQSTNAVFIVGGGGQMNGFEELLAQKLNIPKQRVAIRGKDVLSGITSENGVFKKRPEFVTPVGICLTGLHNNQHDFVEVFLNDESIRIFNTNRLTVMDVVALKGIDPKSFIPKRGKKITYSLNGESHTILGEFGEPAKIYVNQKEADLSTPIKMHDYITIIPAVDGKEQKRLLKDIVGEIHLTINNIPKLIPVNVFVNKALKSPLMSLNEGDEIVCEMPTLKAVLELFEVDYTDIFVNEEPQLGTYIIKNNDNIHTFITENNQVNNAVKNTTKNTAKNTAKNIANDPVNRGDFTASGKAQATDEQALSYVDTVDDTIGDYVSEAHRKPQAGIAPITIHVNESSVTLEGKAEYIFVDIFDFYLFDRTKAKGTLVTRRNGETIQYLDKIHEGDRIELYWKI